MSIGEIDKSSIDVSLFNLLSNPENYHGKQIRVIGVIRHEFEESALYLCKDHYQYHITRNALWIALSPSLNSKLNEIKRLNGKYVVIEGVFNKDNFGHKGLFIGSVEKVNRLIDYELIIKSHNDVR